MSSYNSFGALISTIAKPAARKNFLQKPVAKTLFTQKQPVRVGLKPTPTVTKKPVVKTLFTQKQSVPLSTPTAGKKLFQPTFAQNIVKQRTEALKQAAQKKMIEQYPTDAGTSIFATTASSAVDDGPDYDYGWGCRGWFKTRPYKYYFDYRRCSHRGILSYDKEEIFC
jgi:hypothetical protein